mmetsp:Transcript_18219/g.33075  ORF Transcript_18219/g.33075 Transcript_18219/m.33075 type:complete len:235 (+) Transcript_18219:313-1017(+)
MAFQPPAHAGPSVEFKVVLLGDKGVGKTCLVLRFIEGTFTQKQQSTIGAFFLTKKVQLGDGSMCKIQIWDTAGQERFRAMAPMYYRNAAAAIVCFDITDEGSFNTMKEWVEELRHNVQDKELVLAIACNKADLPNRVVSRQRAEAFASSINAIIIDTSAKDNFGVNELFQKVTETVIDRKGSELIRTAAAASRRGPPPLAGGRQGLSRAAQSAGFNDGSSPLRSIPPPKSNGCC